MSTYYGIDALIPRNTLAIVNADVAAAAAIGVTKLAPGAADEVVKTNAGATALEHGKVATANVHATAGIVDTQLATISTAGKVDGGAITAGTIAGTAAFTGSGGINTTGVGLFTGSVTIRQTGGASGKLVLNDADDSAAWSIQANATITSAWTQTGLAAAPTSGFVSTWGSSGTQTAGLLVNANVDAAAAIVDTKLATISTAGKVAGGAITTGTIAGDTVVNTTGAITGGIITANTKFTTKQFADVRTDIAHSVGAARVVDTSLSPVTKITLTASITGNGISFSNWPSGTVVGTHTLELVQSGAGSFTCAWDAAINWGTSGAPTLSTTAGLSDLITFFTSDGGTNIYAMVVKQGLS